MKKIFTLIFATLMAGNIMAQMHGALRFAGASSVKVLTTNIDNPSDTIKFEMASMSAGNITLPAMKGMATIPSFTRERGIYHGRQSCHQLCRPDLRFESYSRR